MLFFESGAEVIAEEQRAARSWRSRPGQAIHPQGSIIRLYSEDKEPEDSAKIGGEARVYGYSDLGSRPWACRSRSLSFLLLRFPFVGAGPLTFFGAGPLISKPVT